MLRRQVCVLSTTMGRSILLPLCVLYLSCNAQFDGNDNAPEVRKQANGCAYTFLLPIPDDGECFEPNEVASSVSPYACYGEDVSALVKRLQAQGDKIDSLKRIGLQHLWRMDELEANKHELQKANTIQTSRVNELEDENSRLLSELSEQSQEIRRLQRLASQLIKLRNAARENATKLEQLKNQLRTCNGGQDDTAGIDIAPREAKLLFDGTSSITYLDESNPIQELAEMTWCFWMKTVAGMTYDDNTVLVHYQSPFSSRATSHSITYAVTFFIEQLWNYRLRTGGGVTLFKRVPRDGHWHHVCMAWVGRIGKGRRWLYVDGTGTILGDGHVETVLGSGTLYLGFRPDIDYRRTEGFVGEMALFNMWDRHLKVDEIAAFAKECGDATEGNVVGWSAMFGGNAERENTVARQKDFCSNGDCEDVDCITEGACIDAPVGQCSCPSQTSCQSEGRKLRFDGSSRVDVNVNDRVTQIDSLSICMWVKISSSRGTLFSITTPTSTANNAIQKIEFHGFSLAVQTYGGNRHSWYSYLTLDPSKVTDNRWHHVCIVGELAGDRNTILRIYKDGMMITRPFFRQAMTMRGLETISLAGSPDTQSISAEVYGFQFWSRDLRSEGSEIYLMSRRCGEYYTDGALVSWSMFLDAAVGTSVATLPADVCLKET